MVYRLNSASFASESSTVLKAIGIVVPQNHETYGNSMDEKMSSDTPYALPQSPPAEAKPALMLWIVGIIFGSMVIGSGLGLCLGVAIGKFAPGYYRGVFSNGSDPSFDPWSMGVGLGLTQGTVFGAAVGIVSVIVYLWYRSRRSTQDRI